MRRPMMLLSTSLMAAGLVASCSEATPGDPYPSPATETQAGNGGNSDVPKVATPLDAEPFLDRPCDLVPETTLKELGFTEPGKPDIDSQEAKKLIGPRCSWFDKGSKDLAVAVHTPKRDNGQGGLTGVYENHKLGIFNFLEVTEVPGHPDYPAVFSGTDRRSEGDCSTFVGISNDLNFVASVNDRDNPTKACPAAQKVAAAVIDKLKKGA